MHTSISDNLFSLHRVCRLLIIGTAFTFIACYLIFSENVPQQDEYDSILAYLIGSQQSIVDGLLDFHVDRRLVATFLFAKLTLLSGNGVSFRLLSGLAYWR